MHQCQSKTLLGSFTPPMSRVSAMGQYKNYKSSQMLWLQMFLLNQILDNGVHFFLLETLWIDIFRTIRRSKAQGRTEDWAPWFMEIWQSVECLIGGCAEQRYIHWVLIVLSFYEGAVKLVVYINSGYYPTTTEGRGLVNPRHPILWTTTTL